jgi:hypothetical protein
MTSRGTYCETLCLQPNGRVPNSCLPVLIFRTAVKSEDGEDLADVLEATFVRNNWLNNWREVVYDYYHYHSTTHEVLGIAHAKKNVFLSTVKDVERLGVGTFCAHRCNQIKSLEKEKCPRQARVPAESSSQRFLSNT